MLKIGFCLFGLVKDINGLEIKIFGFHFCKHKEVKK